MRFLVSATPRSCAVLRGNITRRSWSSNSVLMNRQETSVDTSTLAHPFALSEGVRAPVYSLSSGDEISSVVLNPEVFRREPRPDIIQRVVLWQLAKRRSGTASTKTRSEVSGSTKKIRPQKGTGGARHGNIRAPIFVGGGVAHGPKPRSYEYALQKKVRRLGLCHALSARMMEQRVVIIDSLSAASFGAQGNDSLKTKDIQTVLSKYGLGKHGPLLLPGGVSIGDVSSELPEVSANVKLPDRIIAPKSTLNSVLFIDSLAFDENLVRAIRNIPAVDCLPVRGLNVYSLMRADCIILTTEAVHAIHARLDGRMDEYESYLDQFNYDWNTETNSDVTNLSS